MRGMSALRVDPHRADPRLALAGRRHDGARGHSAHGSAAERTRESGCPVTLPGAARRSRPGGAAAPWREIRSEEHTSELQSQSNLVCRLLLEKKKQLTRNVHR